MSRAVASTPGQTVGPFFGFALPYEGGPDLVAPGSPGAVRLHGRTLDSAGRPVPDALLELWQPDRCGRIPKQPGSLRRDGWTFTGFGRAGTLRDGSYGFTTVEPGPLSAGAAPFFALTVFARGLTNRLFTRIYLPDTDGLDGDPLLRSLPADRRATLVASRDDHGLSFDVVLQGDNETVFLDFS